MRPIPLSRSTRRGRRVIHVVVAVATLTCAGLTGGIRGVALAAPPGSTQPAATTAPSDVQRISGPTRIDTAIAASKDEFPTAGSAGAVVLARADNFPDALAGGPLAAKVGGPLLLTSSRALDDAVKAEIRRVAPSGSTVYILGGPAAVSFDVDDAVSTLGDVPDRIYGPDRFATAVAIADAMGDPSTIFEATGWSFPDALSGVPAAVKTGGAILLTNGKVQSGATADYLAAHPGGTEYALGGPAADADPSAGELAGDDRFGTSALVAELFFDGAKSVGVATGDNFPDALAAGPDLAAKGAPLLLVPGTGPLAPLPAQYLLSQGASTTNALLFGGTASVSDDVATQVGTLVGARGRAQAADSAPSYDGAFGVMSQQVTADGLTTNSTLVVNAATGDVTKYSQDGSAVSTAAGAPTRAQIAALPLGTMDDFMNGVDLLYRADYASEIAEVEYDLHGLFLLNAQRLLLDPVTPPSIRCEIYTVIAPYSDRVDTVVKDSIGRAGIALSAPFGFHNGQFTFVFDPATWQPLEVTVDDLGSTVVSQTTITSLTTAPTLPGNPYSS